MTRGIAKTLNKEIERKKSISETMKDLYNQNKLKSCYQKGHIPYSKLYPECMLRGEKHPFYNKKHSVESKNKMINKRREWHKNNKHPKGMLGKKHSKRTKELMKKIHKELFKIYSHPVIGKKGNPYGFVKGNKFWKNPNSIKNQFKKGRSTPEEIKKRLQGLLKRPSSFEQKIILLCSKYKLPFIYTGDGRILIGYKNPDFINEKERIIIEVFLNYFKIRDYGSVENYIKKRGEHFAKYGYKTIFIREEEIMDNNWEEICLNKIK